jgi:hypothetical protein
MAETEFFKRLHELQQEGIGCAYDGSPEFPDDYVDLLRRTGHEAITLDI